MGDESGGRAEVGGWLGGWLGGGLGGWVGGWLVVWLVGIIPRLESILKPVERRSKHPYMSEPLNNGTERNIIEFYAEFLHCLLK